MTEEQYNQIRSDHEDWGLYPWGELMDYQHLLVRSDPEVFCAWVAARILGNLAGLADLPAFELMNDGLFGALYHSHDQKP